MFVAHQVRRKAAQRQGSNTKMTQKEQATHSRQVDKAVLFACLMPELFHEVVSHLEHGCIDQLILSPKSTGTDLQQTGSHWYMEYA